MKREKSVDKFGRLIPFVDEGIKDIKDNTYENLQKFYRKCHVGEYVHVTEKGKYLKFEFTSMFKDKYRSIGESDDENPTLRKLSYLEINKKSFMHNMNTSARYINYFIEYFDEDDELMQAYFQIMFMLRFDGGDPDDRKGKKKNKTMMMPDDFSEYMMAYFASPKIVEKVIEMVEYNIDPSLIKKTDRKYDESIQLTLEHLKAIMAVSCLHKFMIPIVSEYYSQMQDVILAEYPSDKDFYYVVFSKAIKKFDKHYNVSLYEKLFHTATTRVSKTINRDNIMWKRRSRQGVDPVVFTAKLMRDFIVDISQKTLFSQSAIIFIHVCFDRAIANELRQKDQFDFNDMKMEASDSVNEIITRFDKWSTDHSGHDQKDVIHSIVSIEDMIVRTGNEYKFEFKPFMGMSKGLKLPKKLSKTAKRTKKEMDFYRDNIPQPLTEAQLFIIYLYAASKLETTADFPQISHADIIKIIMIMKREFLMRNYSYLPFFISGKVDTSANMRVNKNKLMKEFKNHPCYPDFINEYKDTEALFNLDKLINVLKVIVSCPIKAVDYVYEDFNGKIHRPEFSCAIDEFIRFLLDI